MKYVVFTLFVILSFVLFGNITWAQINFQQPVPTEIEVEMYPQNPGPNQTVIVSIKSYGTDLNSGKITWKINGKIEKSGLGIKNFEFRTGDMGVLTTLDITAETLQGEVVKKTIRIRPSSVDIMWQSYGFTPPFYKGKSMFSHQNKIMFIAIPHITGSGGVEVSAKNLIYTWKQNGSVIEYASGYGFNTYTLISPIISRPLNVEVEVVDPNNGGVGYAKIIATPESPSVVLYKKDPLYGIEFQKAFGEKVELKDSREITMVAMPFFFGTLDSNDSGLSYMWSINNILINDGVNMGTRIFRQQEGTSGTSRISLSIENSDEILQTASFGFNLMFDDTNQTQTSNNI